MLDLFSSSTVVIGVGNTILSDDGVGVHAARRMQGDPRVPSGVTILDGGTLGLELIPYASDAPRVLLLDAINSGQAPERLARNDGRMERPSIGCGRSDRGPLSCVSASAGDCCARRAAWQHGLGHHVIPGSRSGPRSSGRRGFGSVATLAPVAGSRFGDPPRIRTACSMPEPEHFGILRKGSLLTCASLFPGKS